MRHGLINIAFTDYLLYSPLNYLPQKLTLLLFNSKRVYQIKKELEDRNLVYNG